MKKNILMHLFVCLVALLAMGTLQAQNKAQTIDQYLTKATQDGFKGVALVAKKGKIIFAKGYGIADRKKRIAFDQNSVFDIGSITKQFTGAAILKLEMEGKLKTTDYLKKYLPSLPKHMHKITLHHLLTHSAGLPGGLGSDEEVLDQKSYLKRLYPRKLSDSFGSFAYSNVGYSLLAIVIENVSRMGYEEFLQKKIFEPAGMTQTGYRMTKWHDKNIVKAYRGNQTWGSTHIACHYNQGVTYHLMGNGGIMSTVLDMHKWYKAIKNNTILSKKATQKYIAKHIKEGDRYYGYGWSTELKKGRELVWHNGGNGFFNAFMGYYLPEDLVVIMSSNYGKTTDPYAHQIDAIMHGEYKALNEKLVAQYSGTYSLPSGEKFKLRFNANNQLIVPINTADLYTFFSGSSADKASVAKEYNQKIATLDNTLLKRDYAKYAETEHKYLPGMSEDAIEREIKQVFEQIEGVMGKMTAVDVLGSVARQGGKYYLTAVKLSFEKGNNYLFHTWQGKQIDGLRLMSQADMIKDFSYRGKKMFVANSNQVKVELTTKAGKPAIKLRGEVLVKE